MQRLSSFDMLTPPESPEDKTNDFNSAKTPLLRRSQVAAVQPKWESGEGIDETVLWSDEDDGEDTLLETPPEDEDMTQPNGAVGVRRRSARIRKYQAEEESQNKLHAEYLKKCVLKKGAKRLKVATSRQNTEYSEEF